MSNPFAYLCNVRQRLRVARRDAERFRRCPRCQVVIEKTGGCNNMHCAMCHRTFLWSNATPINVSTVWDNGQRFHSQYFSRTRGSQEDGVEGRASSAPIDRMSQHPRERDLRACPHCEHLNEKLHSLDDAICANCHREFNWYEAEVVPNPERTFVQNRPRRANDECNRTSPERVPLSPILEAWLDDPRRLIQVVDLNTNALDSSDVPENLLCVICTSKAKSHALQCGHLFCEQCLVVCLRQHPSCPIDRIAVHVPPIRVFL